MIRLIDDMLDVSRISSGRLEILLEDIDLGQLIKNLLERFSLDFKSAGCLLRLELNVDVRCRCDPLRVEQVLSNLLMNALKYAASKPIEISLTRQEEYAVIAVRDHGEGIPPGKLSRVFEKFERAVSSQHISGFGLGLYISRKIVEAHHGSIHVKSELGQGSLFTVKLPLRAV
jgi:signal transduction histidine kinase